MFFSVYLSGTCLSLLSLSACLFSLISPILFSYPALSFSFFFITLVYVLLCLLFRNLSLFLILLHLCLPQCPPWSSPFFTLIQHFLYLFSSFLLSMFLSVYLSGIWLFFPFSLVYVCLFVLLDLPFSFTLLLCLPVCTAQSLSFSSISSQPFISLPFFLSAYLSSTSRKDTPGNTKGGSITVPLTSCLTGLKSAVWQLTKFASTCKTD